MVEPPAPAATIPPAPPLTLTPPAPAVVPALLCVAPLPSSGHASTAATACARCARTASEEAKHSHCQQQSPLRADARSNPMSSTHHRQLPSHFRRALISGRRDPQAIQSPSLTPPLHPQRFRLPTLAVGGGFAALGGTRRSRAAARCGSSRSTPNPQDTHCRSWCRRLARGFRHRGSARSISFPLHRRSTPRRRPCPRRPGSSTDRRRRFRSDDCACIGARCPGLGRACAGRRPTAAAGARPCHRVGAPA